MQAKPKKQHQWLQKFVGDWTYEHECPAENDKPAHKLTGTDTVRSLGGLWVACEGTGQMPDGNPATMLMTLGYDPGRERFVGTWIGSMMTHLWVYDGELNAAGTTLTLNAEGPSCTTEGKTTKYKDVIEFKSDDHRVLTSYSLGEDGKWTQFMTANYKRRK